MAHKCLKPMRPIAARGHDIQRIARAYPHVARVGEHLSPTPTANTGDGTRMAEAVGAVRAG